MLGRVRAAARGAAALKMEALGSLRSLVDIAYCFLGMIAMVRRRPSSVHFKVAGRK